MPFRNRDDLNSRTQTDVMLARSVVRLLFIPPAALFYFCLHLLRRLRRWYTAGRAQSWPAADALVFGNYELDENEVSFSLNGWGDDDDNDRYTPRWTVAILYTYQAENENYSGTYFLPYIYFDGALASEAAAAWINKKIVIRYNPGSPAHSYFLEQDGAPGKPHIPRLIDYEPYLTDLSLK